MAEQAGLQRARLERETYTRVGFTMLGGLLLSMAVMALGLAFALHRGEGIKHVLSLSEELSRLGRGDPRAILDLGILLLFATPLAALLVALAQFARERDVAFMLITSLLVLVIGVGFAVALH
jgi:uncharacterized membrane protein